MPNEKEHSQQKYSNQRERERAVEEWERTKERQEKKGLSAKSDMFGYGLIEGVWGGVWPLWSPNNPPSASR